MPEDNKFFDDKAVMMLINEQKKEEEKEEQLQSNKQTQHTRGESLSINIKGSSTAVAQLDSYRKSEGEPSPKDEGPKINLPNAVDNIVKEASQKKFEAPPPA